MAVGKVQARGQVTLPREIRREAGVEPGDVVLMRAIGPGTVELKVLPRLTLADLIERYPITVPIDEAADRAAWEAAAAKDAIGREDA